MYFCPSCANLLVIRLNAWGQNSFACQTCPYTYSLTKPVVERTTFKTKEVDDILGGAGAWDNVDQTDAVCEKCENPRAYFMQIQIRSADEPMSIFFKCTKCGNQWREG